MHRYTKIIPYTGLSGFSNTKIIPYTEMEQGLIVHSTVLVQMCAVLTDYISYEKNECVREPVQLKPIT